MTVNRAFILHHFTDNIKSYQQYARNIAGIDDADDLFQECAVMLCEYSEERLVGYWNPSQGLKPVFIRMLMLQYRSKTSKFHKEYRKQNDMINTKGKDITHNEDVTAIDEPGKDISDVIQAANSVSDNEIENMIWSAYVTTGSLRKVQAALPDEYKGLISIQLIRCVVTKFQREIKKQLDTLV